MRFEYENLVDAFEHSLLTELRGHGSSADFLRTWVPDPDLTKSLINMADAAELENVAEFEVGITAQNRPNVNATELSKSLSGIYDVKSADGEAGGAVIKFTRAVAR